MKRTIFLLILLSLFLPVSCKKHNPCLLTPGIVFFSEYVRDTLLLSACLHEELGYTIFILLDLDQKGLSKFENDNHLYDVDPVPLGAVITKFKYDKLKYVREQYDYSIGYCAWYTTSAISGKVSITSEVSLYGETPGEDISSHFHVANTYFVNRNPLVDGSDYSIVYPSCSDKPEALSQFYFKGALLMHYLTGTPFVLTDLPTTGVSETTFTVCIPIEDTLYLDAFDLDGSFDESRVRHCNRILTGVVPMSF